MDQLLHASERMMVTRTFTGNVVVELTDKQRLRSGKGILSLTLAEVVELVNELRGVVA